MLECILRFIVAIILLYIASILLYSLFYCKADLYRFKLSPNQAEIASSAWFEKIGRNSVVSTDTTEMVMLKATCLGGSTLTNEQRMAFKIALYERLKKGIPIQHIGTDYEPAFILGEALEAAGIQKSEWFLLFPEKATMWFVNGGVIVCWGPHQSRQTLL